MLEINEYTVASIVLLILFLILLTGSKVMKINLKGIGYYTILSTLAILIVIGVYTVAGI